MIILAGKIKSEGESVFFTPLLNPVFAEMDFQRVMDNQDPPQKTNRILGTSNIDLFNSDLPATWQIFDSAGNKFVVSQLNRRQIEIAMYQSNGTEYLLDLPTCLLEVILY